MATQGREFPNNKKAGRNASEPMSSLVNVLKKSTLWTDGEDRCMNDEITEVAFMFFRGSRVGMLEKISSSVLETRCGDAEEHQPMRIRKRKRIRPYRESEGFIVPIEDKGQHNPLSEGRDPALFMQPKSGGLGDCRDANNS